MKVPELNMFSTAGSSRQSSGKLNNDRWASPSEHYRTAALKDYMASQQRLQQSKSMKSFYEPTKTAQMLGGLLRQGASTAYSTGFYHHHPQDLIRQPSYSHGISKDIGCRCSQKICGCSVHKLTGYVPVSSLNNANNQYFNRTIERLSGYYKNPHNPDSCERCHLHMEKYKRYIAPPSELCEHYPPRRDYLRLKESRARSPTISKMPAPNDRLDETEKILRNIRARIQGAATEEPLKENHNKLNTEASRVAFPKVPRTTAYEEHEMLMEELQKFHDRQILDAVLSVMRHYEIKLATKDDLDAILKIMQSISQTGAHKEHKQAAAMNRLREWHQEKTTTTTVIVTPQVPLPESNLSNEMFRQRLQKASQSLEKYADKIQKKLESPRSIHLDELLRLKSNRISNSDENNSLQRGLMHDMDELIAKTVNCDELISMQSLNYFD